MTTPNEDLLARLRRGEDAARRELFRLCQNRLRPYFHSRLPNTGDIDDCVSEVLARALEGIDRGQQPNVLDAWLFGIARNVLKERYEARRRDGGELPVELPRPAPEPRVEVEDTADLPEVPTELEMLIGKRELWATLDGAINGIGAGLQPIMRAHVRLSREKQRLVVGDDLAAALDMPVTGLNRQLNRARKAMLNAIAALVVARTCRRHCPDLSASLDTMHGAGQGGLGRGVVLDPAQSALVLKHAGECPVCGPRARDAREYSKWALGPGLIGLTQDDDERRRAVIALLSRSGDVPVSSSSPAAAIGALPVPLAAAAPPGLAERVRLAVTARVASVPGVDNVVQFVQQDPDAARRVVAVAVGGVVLAATIMLGLLSDNPGGSSRAEAEGRPPAVSATTTTPPTRPSDAAPTMSPASTTVTTSSVPARENPNPTAPPAVATTTTTPPVIPQTTTTTTERTTEPTKPTTPNPPPPQARDMEIDATETAYTSFGISGEATWRDARSVQSTRLSPGRHVLLTHPGYKIVFTVTESWTIDYDHRFDHVVSGRGSSTLVVRGLPVKVDTSGTDYADTAISGTGWRNAGPVRTLRLLPGAHFVQAMSGAVVRFKITDDGLVEFDSALDPLLTGRNTSTLAVHGLPVTFDTSDTDYTDTAISGTGWRNAGPVRTLRLLPGAHFVQAPTGAVIRFQVTDAGRVEFDPALDYLADGRGTSTLVIHGLPVTFDISDTDYTDMAISGTGWRGGGPVRTLRLLPGAHYVQAPTGAVVRFQITNAGRVEFEPALDHLAEGRGTSTLVIHGLPVTFDTTDTDYTDMAISGTGWRGGGPVRTLRLLPGAHFVQAPTGAVVRFQVTDAGQVEFEPALDHLAEGRGTSTLVIHGLPVTFDISDTDYTDMAISGTGWRGGGPVRTLRLLPGAHYVQAPTGAVVRFQITNAGRVEFEPAVNYLAEGRGTSTLAIHGLPMTFDTTDTDYTDTAISGTGWRKAGPVRTLRLLPGAHYVQAPTGAVIRFQVTDAGRVEFDPSHDRLATGRGTTTLTIHGLPVTFDRSSVDYTYLVVSGVGTRFDGPTYTLRLLPGPHYVQTPQLNAVRFQVTNEGRLEIDQGYDRWARGRGTTTLTVRGVAITVDARATTHTAIQVSGVTGWKDPRQEQTVGLLPGKHRVVALDGRKYDFVVKDNGLIDYDPSLDGVLSGRGGTTLTIR
ncbi:sigma-70 family RNA polymerase sigma factor [Actinophytocola sp.]|uniref:RNA polymerase sigma factor n=1 Tax=Actinophytocola sp. TaxID=1872138 RepID=UPI002ED5E95F